ncbi:MAG TPA: ABC transporter permease [Myxococcaceae bacterium]|nr:ABC transporter permease [Myxococcaceae bacterium]
MREGARLVPTALSVALSLLVCLVAIAVTRGDFSVALDAYAQMFTGGLGDWAAFIETGSWPALTRPWGESASKAALLLLTGLSVAVGFTAGMFNIGAQGQMIAGALVAAVVGAHVALPFGLHPLVALAASGAMGALYGLVPALLKLRRGVHEVISTIMLNWIAVSVVENWLVVGPLRATTFGGTSASGTDQILPSAELPRLLGDASRLHAGFPLAIALAVGAWVWLGRSRNGFEVRAVGLGSEAARTAGIPVGRRTCEAMALAGALAGMAGGVLVLGTEYKFPATLGAPYGFDGIAIALIGHNHPLGVAAAAIFFGVLRAGGTRMQLLGVHQSFPELIQGMALLFVAGRIGWELVLRWRARRVPLAEVEVPRA